MTFINPKCVDHTTAHSICCRHRSPSSSSPSSLNFRENTHLFPPLGFAATATAYICTPRAYTGWQKQMHSLKSQFEGVFSSPATFFALLFFALSFRCSAFSVVVPFSFRSLCSSLSSSNGRQMAIAKQYSKAVTIRYIFFICSFSLSLSLSPLIADYSRLYVHIFICVSHVCK